MKRLRIQKAAASHRLNYCAPGRDSRPHVAVAFGYAAFAVVALLAAIGLLTYALAGHTHMRGPKQYTWWDCLAGGTGLLYLIGSVMAACDSLFAMGIARKPRWWRS